MAAARPRLVDPRLHVIEVLVDFQQVGFTFILSYIGVTCVMTVSDSRGTATCANSTTCVEPVSTLNPKVCVLTCSVHEHCVSGQPRWDRDGEP